MSEQPTKAAIIADQKARLGEFYAQASAELDAIAADPAQAPLASVLDLQTVKAVVPSFPDLLASVDAMSPKLKDFYVYAQRRIQGIRDLLVTEGKIIDSLPELANLLADFEVVWNTQPKGE